MVSMISTGHHNIHLWKKCTHADLFDSLGLPLCAAKKLDGNDSLSKAQDGFQTCGTPRHRQQELNIDQPSQPGPSDSLALVNSNNTSKKKVSKERVKRSEPRQGTKTGT